MTANKKNSRNDIVALFFAIWFLLTSWMWTYFVNLMFSFPIGIMGFFLWKKANAANPGTVLNRITLGIYIAGLVASIAALFLFL